MKNIFFGLASLLVVSSTIIAQDETRKLSSFEEVSVATGINATLIKSTENKVKLTVQNIDLENVITEVKGNKLLVKIKSKGWGWNTKNKKVEAKIYYASPLTSIMASSGAIVEAEEAISSTELNINASSGSNVSVTMSVNESKIVASSGSSIELLGTATNIKASASSGSSIRASDLMSQVATASASSGASIDLWIEKDLQANSSSGGSIRYKGEPQKLDVNKSSGGNVKKRNG